MEKHNGKLGVQIRTPKRMLEVIKAGKPVLMCCNLISIIKTTSLGQSSFEDIMDGIARRHYFEER